MEIKFSKKEVEEFLVKHTTILIPGITENKTITATERYGDYTIYIDDPAAPIEEVAE